MKHALTSEPTERQTIPLQLLGLEQTPEGHSLIALTPDGTALTSTVTRLRWDGHDLHGELRLARENDEVLTADWVLTKPGSRRDILSLLLTGKAHWTELLNAFAREVINVRRMGTHLPVKLHEVSPPPPEQFYNLGVLPPVLRRHINIWFGDGGTGKSYLALAAACELARQGVRPMYLDWELDAPEHRVRLQQLCGASELPDIVYWHREVPLPHSIETLRSEIVRRRIDFLIVDSIGYAVSGAPEVSATANEYTQAVRTLGIGSLHLAHTTKGRPKKDGEKGVSEYPFGSVFWHNGCRMSWNLVRGKESDSTTTVVHAHQRKLNTGAPQLSRYLKITFANDIDGSVTVTRVEDQDDSEQSSPQTIWERVRELLVLGPLTRTEIKASLADVDPKTVDTTIRRGLKKERITESEDRLCLAAT